MRPSCRLVSKAARQNSEFTMAVVFRIDRSIEQLWHRLTLIVAETPSAGDFDARLTPRKKELRTSKAASPPVSSHRFSSRAMSTACSGHSAGAAAGAAAGPSLDMMLGPAASRAGPR